MRSVLPGLDLDDPKFDTRTVEQIVDASKASAPAPNPKKAPCDANKSEDDAQIQTMIDRTGSLDLDDSGNWDFRGHSSGYVFMRKFRAQFGDGYLADSKAAAAKNRTKAHILESPRSANSSPYDFNLPGPVDLPRREVAIELCRNTIDDCCALMRPIHRPTFFKRLHSLYDTEPEQYNNSHVQFLPLLYVVMAVGCMFSKPENEYTMLDIKGYKEAMEQGYVPETKSTYYCLIALQIPIFQHSQANARHHRLSRFDVFTGRFVYDLIPSIFSQTPYLLRIRWNRNARLLSPWTASQYSKQIQPN